VDKVALAAEHRDGRVTEGEAQIPQAGSPIVRIFIRPQNASAAPDAVRAIQEAELIILGPGSLYTSIIPNLLIAGIRDAIISADVPKVYVCNVMTQVGETDGFKASDHVRELVKHTHPKILDACIINNGRIPPPMVEKYAQENSAPVVNDSDTIKSMGYGVIEEDLVSVTDHVRHDAKKLAKIIAHLMNLDRHAHG
jgi:uncharacterized cofD-like protein